MNVPETGVEFNFTYAPGITEQQILGVELAGEMWANYLGDTHQYIDDDDITHIEKTLINIHVEIDSDILPDNVIGGAFPTINKSKYEDVYDALTGDITTGNDATAVDSLIQSKKTDILINGEIINNEKMQLTKANLKALDLIETDEEEYAELDGYILLSDLNNFNTVEWNYDYLGGAKEGTLDFLTTVTHEIGHTLGFISGTDRVALTSETFGYYQTYASVNAIEQGLSILDSGKYSVADGMSRVKFQPEYENDFEEKEKFKKAQSEFYRAIDELEDLLDEDASEIDREIDPKQLKEALEKVKKYLKYDPQLKGLLDTDKEVFNSVKENLDVKKLAERMTSLDLFRYSNASSRAKANELTRGVSSYFSLDGSRTNLTMSDGKDYQGSHWKNSTKAEGLGVMNPTISLNQRWEISSNDLLAMDAIGWDVNYNADMDLQALYDKAASAVDSAWIGDRSDDVEDIITGKAYGARRSLTSKSSSYRMDAGFFATGYFSTFSEPVVTATDNSNNDSDIITEIDNWVVLANNSQPVISNFDAPKVVEVDLGSSVVIKDSSEETEQTVDISQPQVESKNLEEIIKNLSELLNESVVESAVSSL